MNYISVDIESFGPSPDFALASIGACEASSPSNGFYVELKPSEGDRINEQTVEVHGLSVDHLKRHGLDAKTAMERFFSWLSQFERLVMVSFGTFDWMYIATYFHRHLGQNPFGVNGVDIKSYYMGFAGVGWPKTTKGRLPKELRATTKHTHHALGDAREQAEIFTKIMAAAEERKA